MAKKINIHTATSTLPKKELKKAIKKIKKADKKVAKKQKAKKVELNDWQCPECQSDEIVGEEIMVEGGQASQECHCNTFGCNARWYNVYNFSHSEKIA